MTAVTLLDADLLDSLEERWRDRGAQTATIMRPGLSDEEIDRIAAPLEFDLPDEIRTLYRWHNGSSGYSMIWGRGMVPLGVAVPELVNSPEWDEERRPGWLRILDERPYLAADCTASGLGDPVPIWHYGPEAEPATRPVFASIGDMVTFWIMLIDDGRMYWDDNMWQIRDDMAGQVLRLLRGIPQA
jgi:hypothetical protein